MCVCVGIGALGASLVFGRGMTAGYHNCRAACDLFIGTTINGYSLIGLAGSGADGAVFHAVDSCNRPYAAKVTFDGRQGMAEAEILQQLRGVRGVLQLYDRFPVVGDAFMLITSPYCRATMGTIEGLMDCCDWLSFVAQAGMALYRVHERGICHRDLHTGNIAIDHHGNFVVIDFGRAKKSDFYSSELSFENDMGRDVQTVISTFTEFVGRLHQTALPDDHGAQEELKEFCDSLSCGEANLDAREIVKWKYWNEIQGLTGIEIYGEEDERLLRTGAMIEEFHYEARYDP